MLTILKFLSAVRVVRVVKYIVFQQKQAEKKL